MKTSIRTAGSAKIVDVEGDVDLSSSANFRRMLFETLQGAHRLAVNFAGVRYIDSSGIATLIEVLKESQRLSKEFVLFGLSPAACDVLTLTHVINIFHICKTEEQALQPLT